MVENLSIDEQMRLNSFQTWQQGTERLLKQPAIASRLGGFGTQLLVANAESFMPNVNNGVVSLPQGKEQSNGFAVLPYLGPHEASTLTADLDLIRPTPNRLAHMHRYAAEHGLYQGIVDDTIAAALGARQPRMAGFLGTVEGLYTFTRPWFEVEKHTNLTFGGRPTIAVDVLINPAYKEKPILQWAEIIHELTHGIDMEAWTDGFRDYADKTKHEVRAYAAQEVALDFFRDRGGISAEEYAVYCESSIIANDLRRKHGWSTEQVLNGDFTVTAEEHQESLIKPMIDADLVN